MLGATTLVVIKAVMIFAGVAVFLRLIVAGYEQIGGEMAGDIAAAALERARKERKSGPRVTLSPADDRRT